jgi:hypothetical protein
MSDSGVLVPAMRPKMAAWSRRRMTWRPRGPQVGRWYSALVPNMLVVLQAGSEADRKVGRQVGRATERVWLGS